MLINFFREIFHRLIHWFTRILIKPVVVEKPDAETRSLLNDPEFLSILEQGRAQKEKGGFSEEEMKQWLKVESAKK
jgi:hypothetical protein